MKMPDLNAILKDYPEFSGIHPIAGAFPMKPEDEFWELVEHIRENGVARKLMREKESGLLIDGRNRLMAISLTDSLFEVEDVPSEFVLAHVTANNLHAKKFDASQRAVIAARLRPFYDQAAKARQGTRTDLGNIPQKVAGGNDARDAAGKAAGVNHHYVDLATQIERASPALADKVLAGQMTLKDAHVAAKPIIAAAKAEQSANKPSAAVVHEMAEIVTVDGRKSLIRKPEKPTFNVTNDSVSWARWTWNPITGCEHGCKFCYAREIAHSQRMAEIYPFQFAPAFHEYRLAAPANTRCPETGDERDGRVFVCSMADLFGKWVPDAWIKKVFAACTGSPEWEYLFLTKWPKRYSMLADLPKAWFGASIIKQGDVDRVTRDMTAFDVHPGIVRWVSLEPMLEPIKFGDLAWCDLVVIGAQTSTNQPDGFVPAFAPSFEWVADVVLQCREQGVPYYLKENLQSNPGMKWPQMQPRRRRD